MISCIDFFYGFRHILVCLKTHFLSVDFQSCFEIRIILYKYVFFVFCFLVFWLNENKGLEGVNVTLVVEFHPIEICNETAIENV